MPKEEIIIVVVESDNVVSATFPLNGDDVDENRLETLYTIDDFFDYIQNSIGENAYKVDV